MEMITRSNIWPESEEECEEAGSLWLWAFPTLLSWPNHFVWLFAPVVGRHYPGDLWGLDCHGRLLLVETKLANKPQDPLLDFLAFERRLSGTAEQLYPQNIEKRWHNLLQSERLFLRNDGEAWKRGERRLNTQPGVVPYSSKRHVVWCWRTLYFSEIAPLFEDGSDYENRVAEYLRIYEAKKPAPEYIGLFTTFNGQTARLSKKGKEHLACLRQVTGGEGVHLRVVQGIREDQETASFYSWELPTQYSESCPPRSASARLG
jgi:hypothetical protein